MQTIPSLKVNANSYAVNASICIRVGSVAGVAGLLLVGVLIGRGLCSGLIGFALEMVFEAWDGYHSCTW